MSCLGWFEKSTLRGEKDPTWRSRPLQSQPEPVFRIGEQMSSPQTWLGFKQLLISRAVYIQIGVEIDRPETRHSTEAQIPLDHFP
ncbi:hypothetical protein CLV47_12318 [Antricoccus suffuscus]|uniref:Uncharacterized protein n=1 Tax=Antricoccus suffuscus TaxID=1629062 RepID=A0A2T0ZEL2_9ACTN|nr:hypothetical protein CLV47_12318 [Antricoccus suffuscus]